MAKRKPLTDVQQEIYEGLRDGKTPDQIAHKRKVSTNAIYQQIRRIKAAGYTTTPTEATGNARSARRASGGASSARKPTRSKTRRQSNVRHEAPAPRTAEDLLKSEIALIEGGLEERTTRIAEAEAVIALTREEIAKLEAEKERKEDVLAVLSGEKVAHARPTPKSEARSSRKSTPQPATPVEAPQPEATPVEAPQAETVVETATANGAGDDDAFFDPAEAAAQAESGEPVAS